ncbi:MAG: TetR family transcriptional regulator [Rhodospirillaceae bacterium]|jgi:TetR/AcrR family transcriptional repressor of nem operon|nr:TetR family transcriptional regulator [Rhodospirillaceae bacterium]|tara:strand:+ start:1924 stop:2505 length:582 start_codon:yes stop_codon:yes gene_type:complete
MARPREFDATEALNQAMQVFWSRGYEATSLSDLIGAMKLSKSSFYDTFGSKHEVFLAAIEHYKKTVTAQVSAVSGLDAPARKLIESLFERAVNRMTEEGGKRGCFLNKCAVEVALDDPAAAKLIGGGFAIMEDTFLALVERGQREGEIAPDKDPRALARYLTSSLNGLMVVGKANPDPEALSDVARTALTVLD